MPDKRSEVRIVSQISAEMRQSIISLAGVRGWGETRQRWIEKAARKAGISYRTTKSLFYSEMPDPKASIVARVRQAAEKKLTSREGQAQNEFARLESRLRHIEKHLAAIDPDFDRNVVVENGREIHGLGCEDSPVDCGD